MEKKTQYITEISVEECDKAKEDTLGIVIDFMKAVLKKVSFTDREL